MIMITVNEHGFSGLIAMGLCAFHIESKHVLFIVLTKLKSRIDSNSWQKRMNIGICGIV